MGESLGERKQQEKIPVLLGLRRKYAVLAGHPRPLWRNRVDLSLQDTVQIPHAWIEHIYHVGSSISCSSIVQSGLIAGGKIGKKDDKQYSSQQGTL